MTRQFARTRHRDQVARVVRTVLRLLNFSEPVVLTCTLSTAAARDAAPPMWNVRMVSWVPGSPIDCAAITPTASPMLTQMAAREIAAVAQRADAEARFAGDRRTHLDRLHAGRVELLDHRFVEQRVARDDRILVVAGRVHVLGHHAAEHAIAQRLDHVAAFDDRRHGRGRCGAAIGLGDDHVLRDVDQTTRQVTRVRGLQRGIGQALASAVRRVEVLQHVQAFAEVGLDRRLDDRAVRTRHQAAHAGELADLRRANRARRSRP